MEQGDREQPEQRDLWIHEECPWRNLYMLGHREAAMLWRRNRDMAITVRADVKDGEQGVSATQSIKPMLADIEAKLPFGYRFLVESAACICRATLSASNPHPPKRCPDTLRDNRPVC